MYYKNKYKLYNLVVHMKRAVSTCIGAMYGLSPKPKPP